jgi:hypothetical protein
LLQTHEACSRKFSITAVTEQHKLELLTVPHIALSVQYFTPEFIYPTFREFTLSIVSPADFGWRQAIFYRLFHRNYPPSPIANTGPQIHIPQLPFSDSSAKTDQLSTSPISCCPKPPSPPHLPLLRLTPPPPTPSRGHIPVPPGSTRSTPRGLVFIRQYLTSI